MNSVLAHLKSRRAWLVRDINVWGMLYAQTLVAITTEIDDAQTRVVFLDFPVGGQPQKIAFADLTDHRGSSLPSAIDAPVVIPIAKNAVPVAIIGMPTSASFRIAKTSHEPDDAIVDLWIIEAGS